MTAGAVKASWLVTGVLLVSACDRRVRVLPGLGNPDTNQTMGAGRNHYVLDWWTPFGS